MLSFKSAAAIAASTVVSLASISHAAVNLVANPSFETGALAPWGTYAQPGNGFRLSTFPGDVQSGTYGLVADIASAGTGFNGVFQNDLSVTGGTQYAASGYVQKANSQGNSYTYLALIFFDAANNKLSEADSVAIGYDTPFVLTSVNATAPANATSAQLQAIVFQTAGQTGQTEYFGYDNFSVAAVPEPASLGVIAAVGLFATSRRRRPAA